MKPKYWYCQLCGYMYVEPNPTVGNPGNGISPPAMDCPACGAEATPCWDCVRMGIFDRTMCRSCPGESLCPANIGPGERSG